MPIYEYKCESCNEKFELLQGINEALECKRCGSKELTRLLSTPARPIMGGSSNPGDSGTCCGLTNPCSDPRSCCGA
ncbi:MAG: zinc ribbon domain-containing protein [bacterium]|nr:zinc ribbon domain-containing protein [bacterium]